MKMPQALVFVLGAVGAVLVGRLLAREWQRVNDELDRAKAEPVAAKAERTVLRRDPATGVYSPTR